MKQSFRYHPLLVTLHWLLAVVLIAMLATGFFIIGTTPNADPHKIGALRIHMIAGVVILNLMIIRLVVRLTTAKPAAATESSWTDRIAPIAHYGFYAVVVVAVMSGFATALLAGLNRIMFQGSADPLPPTFAAYPTFVAHVYVAEVLAGLIAVHALAALYRQFVRKDGLLGRMSFGPSVSESSAPAE